MVYLDPPSWRTRAHSRAVRSGVAGAGLLLLAACGGNKPPPLPLNERPPETLYNEALNELAAANLAEAARLFEEVERQHPYSVWATRAELLAAFSLFSDQDYISAIAALDRFIRQHPGDDAIAYAYYLRAIAHYNQITDVERDQRITEASRDALADVIRRFPQTDYARDAQLKWDLTQDHLAGRDMSIGRWYLRRKQYHAAIGRFNVVINDYQTTSHVPEALHRLTEAYLSLGLTGAARETAGVLSHNYPGSRWYQDTYALLEDPSQRTEDPPGLTQRLWKSISGG